MNQTTVMSGLPVGRTATVVSGLSGGQAEVAALARDDAVDDRQPEAGSTQFPGASLVDSVEPLKEPRQIFRGDSNSIIDNFDQRTRTIAAPSTTGAGEYAPSPPVFGPVSPSSRAL